MSGLLKIYILIFTLYYTPDAHPMMHECDRLTSFNAILVIATLPRNICMQNLELR